MQITKKNNEQGQLVIEVVVPFAELTPLFDRTAVKLSKEVKVKGFRPGSVPFDVLRRELGDMYVLEETARQLIAKEADGIIDREATGVVVGRPFISLNKIAWDNDLEFSIAVDLLPEVKLASYKDNNLTVDSTAVTDEELAKVFLELRESRVKEAAVTRPVVDGDKVVVDIKMFLDNVPVDGGQSKGVAVILGKNYIIPGFDKELLGAEAGQDREFTLPFPADHHQRNLAGKMVNFVVTVKDVFSRELPVEDNELAASFQAATIDELRDNVRENMEHEKLHRAEEKVELALIDKLINESEFSEIPKSLVASEKELMMKEMKRNVEQYGGKFEDYLLTIKKTVDDLMNDFEPDAIRRVKSAIIIRKIIELEKIEPTEHDVNHEMNVLLSQYGHDAKIANHIKSADYKREIANQLAIRQAVEKLKEWNIADHKPHHH